MSEYQRYEFMTIDQPLTRAQLDEVNDLSSHIEASSTHAIIEYHWGDFKHNAIDVLKKFFDGFLYWANWGSPQLAFRFPHGALPADLIEGYDFDDFVTFTRSKDYDILDIHFGELESSDMWTEYELGSLIPIREELLEGDLRGLYIAWLKSQETIWGYDEEDEEDEETDEEDDEHNAPPVPPGLAKLTAAQQALVELLQLPEELVVAAGRHSSKATAAPKDDFATWITLLSSERRDDYLLRLARNEPGLSRQLAKELRGLGKDKTKVAPSTAEHVPYVTLLTESKGIKNQLALEKFEQEQQAHQRHLQSIHDHRDDHWQQVDQAASRGTGSGYDEAVTLLVELREAANKFQEAQQFQERFRAWVRPHLRRPALVKRLQSSNFTLPVA
jgi:hypothetical protein